MQHVGFDHGRGEVHPQPHMPDPREKVGKVQRDREPAPQKGQNVPGSRPVLQGAKAGQQHRQPEQHEISRGDEELVINDRLGRVVEAAHEKADAEQRETELRQEEKGENRPAASPLDAFHGGDARRARSRR